MLVPCLACLFFCTFTGLVSAAPGVVRTWADVRRLETIKLNFGGGALDRHPSRHYRGYVSVETFNANETFRNYCTGGNRVRAAPHAAPGCTPSLEDKAMSCAAALGHTHSKCRRLTREVLACLRKDEHVFGDRCHEWCVCYAFDASAATPLPLHNASVERILSEHCFEHIPYPAWSWILVEFHRILVSGGWVRLSVPDYGHPSKAAFMARLTSDPSASEDDDSERYHVTRPTYSRLLALFADSPFRGGVFYSYVDLDSDYRHWVTTPLDHSLGFLKRTPDHGRGYGYKRGTSIIVDLVKRVDR